jgi:hypothetical protein
MTILVNYEPIQITYGLIRVGITDRLSELCSAFWVINGNLLLYIKTRFSFFVDYLK